MDIKLLVIRTIDIKRLADFYTLFGLIFDYHKHVSSPYHFSTTIGQTVLEIYPLSKGQTDVDKNLRLGFSIDDFDNVISKLQNLKVKFVLEPIQTEFGFMTIITDPDDRKIELYKK